MHLPCPPFLSPWPNLHLISACRLWIHSIAKQHNLCLLYKCEFHHIYLEEHAHPKYGPLLRWMRVVDEREESMMDEDQWDAAGASIPSLPLSLRGCLEFSSDMVSVSRCIPCLCC